MYYVGNYEGAPHCEKPAPYTRTLRVLLSPQLDPTQGDLAAGLTELPPGSKSDWRGHEEGEMFFCVKGHGHMRLGDDLFELKPCTTVYAPPAVPHQTFNDEDGGDMVLLWVLVPPFGGDRAIVEEWERRKEV